MTDLWELASSNTDVLRFSTLFTAQQVPKLLGDDAAVDAAIEWCRAHAITHVYLESFRSEFSPPPEMVRRAAERFRTAGLLVSGCMTPSSYGRHSIHWKPFSCYTAEETRRGLRAMSEGAAALFDVVMIDDFLATDCTCPDCRAARGRRSWAEFKCEMMTELSRTHIIGAGRAVNPNCEFIIKFPAWYRDVPGARIRHGVAVGAVPADVGRHGDARAGGARPGRPRPHPAVPGILADAVADRPGPGQVRGRLVRHH